MVEHESRDAICPYPGPGVLQRIRDRTNKKAKEKRDEKKKLEGGKDKTKKASPKTRKRKQAQTQTQRKTAPQQKSKQTTVEPQPQQQSLQQQQQQHQIAFKNQYHPVMGRRRRNLLYHLVSLPRRQHQQCIHQRVQRLALLCHQPTIQPKHQAIHRLNGQPLHLPLQHRPILPRRLPL
mmetsp:Transcript_58409/g.67356  ORF Transcript_58409/g.67356 Transcript_58409/m.67356 type:complete len:178 (+) Transcript_58409:134-667(+)